MKKDIRIIFMGTPAFAVASLGALLMNGYNVVGVVTAPDKPAGRGRSMRSPEVKKYAEHNCLPLFQPRDLREPSFLRSLKELKPDIIVVVAFRYLPEELWSIPPMGTVNLHASLLPQYRGAAPINHAIINGETMTGVSTFLINHDIDTGNILFRQEVPIYSLEDAGGLHDRLMRGGARLLIQTLEALRDGSARPIAQDELMKAGELLRTAPKLTPRTSLIEWDSDPMTIHNLVRGLSPAPGARSCFRKDDSEIMFKLFETLPDYSDHSLPPGSLVSDGRQYLKVACRGGFINILSLQLAGRKRMNTGDLLRGIRLTGFMAGNPL